MMISIRIIARIRIRIWIWAPTFAQSFANRISGVVVTPVNRTIVYPICIFPLPFLLGIRNPSPLVSIVPSWIISTVILRPFLPGKCDGSVASFSSLLFQPALSESWRDGPPTILSSLSKRVTLTCWVAVRLLFLASKLTSSSFASGSAWIIDKGSQLSWCVGNPTQQSTWMERLATLRHDTRHYACISLKLAQLIPSVAQWYEREQLRYVRFH